MTVKQNTAEGGTVSAVVTNTDTGSGDGWQTVGGSPIYVDTPTAVGARAYSIVAANDLLWWTGFTGALGTLRFAFRLTANTGLSGLRLAEIRTGTRSLARVYFDASNRLVLSANNNATSLGNLSTTVPSVDTWYVLEMAAESSNSGDATVKARWYLASTGPGTVIGEASSDTVSQGTTSNATTRTLGRGAADSYAGQLFIDQVYAEDGTLTYPGMWSLPITDSFADNLALIEADGGTPPFTIAQDSGASTTPEELDDGSVSGTGRWLVAKHVSDTLVYTITDAAAVDSDPVNVPPISPANSFIKRPTGSLPSTTWE